VRSATVTWLGHATALVELDGVRVLIDPFGRRRCRPIAGYRDILITHAHTDHLNRWTLSRLDRRATLWVPAGAREWVEDLGFAAVREVAPGDRMELGGIEVSCVPTRHDPGRWGPAEGPICTGYVLARGGRSILHPGDIDMSDHSVFDRIGRDFAPDVALLPIGGWLPVWYYRLRRGAVDRGVHIDPDTALDIALRLGRPLVVPIHWGTLHARLGPPRAPLHRLMAAARRRGLADRMRVLEHGESLSL
jgi:L-ascorbate metabolism protein UlaG (beta-lactamase superfamily)